MPETKTNGGTNGNFKVHTENSDGKMGYNNPDIVTSGGTEDLLRMFDKLTRVADGRRIEPLNQYENVVYPNRVFMTEYNLQIGDCVFMIPPEFISINSESTTQPIVTLRQENSTKSKPGFHKRTIIIDLVFNGMEQINGYKVESPTGYYYVDGLRQLLAQFKCTPFLPVVNELINGTYAIFSVALQAITISTVPSFPTMLTANIILQEVDMFPYLEMPSAVFKDMIDWDLFRFYYQRFLTEKPQYKKLKSLPVNKEYNKIKFSILSESIFTEEKATRFNFVDLVMNRKIVNPNDPTSNFETYLDSSVHNFHVVSMQCGYSNILTNIQLSDCSAPTIQFIGGMDTIFGINIETTDPTVIQLFESLRINNDMMTRKNAKFSTMGFVKIESEFLEFAGSNFVMIENVITNTVPGFPGLYNIEIKCISYDISQSTREALNGFKPFDCNYKKKCGVMNPETKEYESDHIHTEQTIEQSFLGLNVKITQDNFAENKLRNHMEVYPDLYLPTYREINEFIKKCNEFRNKYGLRELPYDVYPVRPECMLHGMHPANIIDVKASQYAELASDLGINKYELSYNGYADPDFYVFYPSSYFAYKEMYKDFEPTNRESQTKKLVRQTRVYNEGEADQESGEYIPTGTSSELVERFMKELEKQIGVKYIWGAAGPPSRGFDCSGLIDWCLKQIGIKSGARLTTTGLRSQSNPGINSILKRVPYRERRRGDLLVNGHHVVVVRGDGTAIHAPQPGDVVKIANEKACIEPTRGKYTGTKPDPEGYWVFRPIAFENAQSVARDTTLSLSQRADRINSSTEDNEKKIWNIMRSLGFSEEAAAGIAGAWAPESSNNPNRIEGDHLKGTPTPAEVYKDRSKMNYWAQVIFNRTRKVSVNRNGYKASDGNYYVGIGLAQWTGERAKKLLDFGKEKWNTIETQLEFFKKEINSSGYSKAKTGLDSATTPEEAGYAFARYYEGAPASMIAERQRNARRIYNKLKGSPVDSSLVSSNNTTPKHMISKEGFKEICRRMFGLAYNYENNSEIQKATAQMIFDMLTSKRYKSLEAILTSEEIFPKSSYGREGDANTEAIARNVFCKGEKAFPEWKILGYNKANDKSKLYETNKKRFKEATPEVKNITYWGKKERSSTDILFYIEGDSEGFVNDGSNYDTSTSEITYGKTTIEYDRFAEPYFLRNDAFKYDDNWYGFWTRGPVGEQELNDEGKTFSSAYVNESQYSCRGRLVRAFPTYLLCIIDDETQWYDGRKLWNNYYTSRAVVDIQVHEAYDTPNATATVVVSNLFENLSRKSGGINSYDGYEDLSALGKWWKDFSGQYLDFFGPDLTEQTIKLKQVIYQNAKLQEGVRIHLRIGYGSDPLSLAPVINGNVSDLSVGEQISMVITSDGNELVNSITSASEKDVNKGFLGLFGLGADQESSNIIANILCQRQSWLNYVFSEWFEGSDYGIEHFGLYFNQTVVTKGIVDSFSGAFTWGIKGLAIGAATGNPIGMAIGGGIGLVGGTIFGSNPISINDLWDGYAEQYDLLKNIYKANYKKDHYIYVTNILGIDFEENIVFNKYNMTPWDVFQVCTQQVPEYIIKPSYHQFDSRIYFGLPFWMEKYRYDIFNGVLYEECKASCQMHILDSVTNIIDNQITVTSKFTDTNKKVMYTRGSSAVSTCVIHSDDTIDNAKQKTGILDTVITQDCLGPDALYELLGYRIGEDSAKRVGVSSLIYGWEQQYQGQIICLGVPGTYAHDYFMINDTYANIFGIAKVREVIHSFSVNTGFTTSITPGMLAFDTAQTSGMIIEIQNHLSVLQAFSAFLNGRSMIKYNYEKLIKEVADMAVLEMRTKSIVYQSLIKDGMIKYNMKGGKPTGNAIAETIGWNLGVEGKVVGFTWMTAKTVKTFIGAFHDTTKLIEVGTNAYNGYKAVRATYLAKEGAGFLFKVKGIPNLTKALATGGIKGLSTMTGPAAIIVFIIGIVLDMILKTVFDFIENRNKIVLLPLWFEGRPFVSGVNGGKNILLTGEKVNSNIHKNNQNTIPAVRTVEQRSQDVADGLHGGY